MKFLCDVHISFKLVYYLNSVGFKTLHVNNILNSWRTKDIEICSYADNNGFIVITKDSDFKDSFLLKQSPQKLIKINLGNITNDKLIKIISDNIELISSLNESPVFIMEINYDKIFYTVPGDQGAGTGA